MSCDRTEEQPALWGGLSPVRSSVLLGTLGLLLLRCRTQIPIGQKTTPLMKRPQLEASPKNHGYVGARGWTVLLFLC